MSIQNEESSSDIHQYTAMMLGLERVAEELMGRRKWKLYQDALLPRYRSESRGEGSSEEEAEPPMPAAEPPAAPALKIKTIEQINTTQEEENTNTPEYGTKPPEPSPQPKETILESLIKRPATQPRVPTEDTFDQWKPTGKLCPSHRATDEPLDWKPADKCYFCVEEPAGNVGAAEQEAGGGGAPGRSEGGANSPAASDSGSSSVSGGARSPGAPPALLAHLLQLQNHNPQAIAQLQQMMAALAALGTGLMPPAALSQAWLLQRLQQNQMLQQQQHVDRLTADMGEKVSVSNSSPLPFAGAACVQAGSATEQPLDLSARSGSSTGEPATPPPDTKLTSRVPPIDPKFLANVRLKRPATDGLGSMGNARRAYTEDELQNALRDIKSGRLGTRRAAVLYGIPRSTLRNKVYKLALDQPTDADGDRDSADEDDAEAYRSLLLQAPDAQQRDDDDAAGVILKIPTFPPPDRDDSPPPTQVPLYDPPHMPGLPPGPHERLFSLRDVIAKSINQKFHQPPPDIRPDGQQDLAFGRPPDRHISVIKHLPDGQRSFSHVNNAGHSRANNNGATPAPGGKGTRPKRGKYRNYDRDSLVEAVKAVQRGEMSVHRAGSYYGVPHSTLEYKVKERHLMRPRKREPKQPLTTDNKPQVPPKPTVQKPQVKPGFSNGMNGPDSLAGGYPPPGYPFWSHPASFPPMASGSFTPGSELFASHMMQRLREESTPQVPTANGSFLEGIIRSTLDRPALLQRLAGEPPPQQNSIGPQRLNDMNASNLKANANLLQRLNSDSSPNLPQSATLLQRLTCETADEGSPPPARRPRLSSSDRQLAAEMRETVQRLRADKLRAAGRNGTPTPPVAVPATTTAPSDRA